MGNPGASERCVSLHVYAPPYAMCNVFDPRTGSAKTAHMRSVNQIPVKEGTSLTNLVEVRLLPLPCSFGYTFSHSQQERIPLPASGRTYPLGSLLPTG